MSSFVSTTAEAWLENEWRGKLSVDVSYVSLPDVANHIANLTCRANSNLLWVFDDHCLDKDYVGFVRFNHAVDDNLYFPLGRKGDNLDMQRKILSDAVDAEGGTRL